MLQVSIFSVLDISSGLPSEKQRGSSACLWLYTVCVIVVANALPVWLCNSLSIMLGRFSLSFSQESTSLIPMLLLLETQNQLAS